MVGKVLQEPLEASTNSTAIPPVKLVRIPVPAVLSTTTSKLKALAAIFVLIDPVIAPAAVVESKALNDPGADAPDPGTVNKKALLLAGNPTAATP